MLTDPLFYAAAIPAVVLIGMSKGGFGGGLALVGVPLLALVMPAQQAAGIMLPILMVMDAIGLYAYRRHINWRLLKIVLPAALGGTALGWALAAVVSDDGVRLMVGLVAIAFSIDFVARGGLAVEARTPPRWVGALCGLVSGFTSFIAHAGGPPLQVYFLPQRLPKEVFAGTNVGFFAIINAAKIIPFAHLGQLSVTNLEASALLTPIALLATLLGVWLVKKTPLRPFYLITYTSVFLVGLKLFWDGARGLGWL